MKLLFCQNHKDINNLITGQFKKCPTEYRVAGYTLVKAQKVSI
jgi:hypothetical protein